MADYTQYVITVNMSGKRWVYWSAKNDSKPVRISRAVAEYRLSKGAFLGQYKK